MKELAYTLQLFDDLIKRQPVGLSDDIRQAAQEDLNSFQAQEHPDEKAVEDAMIHYGKQAWPYWQAEFELLEIYGKQKEKELFMEKLPADLQEKWKKYESSLTADVVFDHGEKFEEAFSPEENHVIEEAVVEAKQQAVENIREMARGEKAKDYQMLVDDFTDEQENIEQKIAALVAIKDKTEKWDAEIDDLVRYFEKGFAELELRPSVERVQEKIDFYNGQIEGFED